MRALPLALIAAISATPLAQAQSTNAIPPAEANEALAEAAEAARQRFQEMTFEEYRDSLPRKDGDGAYIVNGDVPIRNEKLLLETLMDTSCMNV